MENDALSRDASPVGLLPPKVEARIHECESGLPISNEFRDANYWDAYTPTQPLAACDWHKGPAPRGTKM
jgi:hypothetical protein